MFFYFLKIFGLDTIHTSPTLSAQELPSSWAPIIRLVNKKLVHNHLLYKISCYFSKNEFGQLRHLIYWLIMSKCRNILCSVWPDALNGRVGAWCSPGGRRTLRRVSHLSRVPRKSASQSAIRAKQPANQWSELSSQPIRKSANKRSNPVESQYVILL